MSKVAKDERLVEELAEYAHDAWAGWMVYMFSKCEPHVPFMQSGNGYWMHIKMPDALYERWKRQMRTPYKGLPESEKESDRVEACKIIQILRENTNRIYTEVATEEEKG